jgi:serine/threonine protein kinase
MEKSHSDYIGPYKILKRIALGGMGEIFLVEDLKNSRQIALKKIRNDKMEHNKERFLKEATLGKVLSHPAILPVYEIVDEKNEFYFTMPFIEGSTIKQWLHDKLEQAKATTTMSSEIDLPFTLDVFASLCQVVSHAHSKGVLHRDLKPSNILIGKNGDIYLLDWGLAQKFVEIKEKNEKLLISGTFSYLAPEILSGIPYSVQCEIYSLGLILYELLTLRHPFHRETVEEYCQNLDREILVDPATVAPYWNIPSFLSKIVLKCLDSPENRYQDVESILKDLKKGEKIYLRELKKFKQSLLELQRNDKTQFTPAFLDQEKYINWDAENQNKALLIHFYYLLKRPEALVEMIRSLPLFPLIGQALMALIALKSYPMAQRELDILFQKILDAQAFALFESIQSVLEILQQKKRKIVYQPKLPKRPKDQDLEPVFLVLEEAFRRKQMEAVSSIVVFIEKEYILNLNQLTRIDSYLIWSFLLSKKWENAKKIVDWHLETNPDSTLMMLFKQCIESGAEKNTLIISENWEKHKTSMPEYINKLLDKQIN